MNMFCVVNEFFGADLLKQKDIEILSLLEEKVRLFRGMWEGLSSSEEARQVEPFFRSDCSHEPPRGAAIMKDALQEGKSLCNLQMHFLTLTL